MSSSSTEDGRNGGGGQRRDVPRYDAPSSSRRRRRCETNEVWPEPFLEALAAQVALEASRTHGRLAAAPSLANLFQVRPPRLFLFLF